MKKKANKSVVDKLQTRLDVFEDSSEVKQRDLDGKCRLTESPILGDPPKKETKQL